MEIIRRTISNPIILTNRHKGESLILDFYHGGCKFAVERSSTPVRRKVDDVTLLIITWPNGSRFVNVINPIGPSVNQL